ncbi:MAG: hypothetical protein P8I91_05385 [Phycisphaerales bacterium]|nr:hypothetical protein [Phycisphaerales bacterium]
MPSANHQPTNDALQPLPFPVAFAQSIETPCQQARRIRAESNRSIQALAVRLGCLGWFDSTHPGPRAA